MAKNTHHVVPRQDGWAVKKGGATRASKVFDTQAGAIQYARDKARIESGELYVHRRDGTIRQRDSYGNDPNRPRDKK